MGCPEFVLLLGYGCDRHHILLRELQHRKFNFVNFLFEKINDFIVCKYFSAILYYEDEVIVKRVD